MVNSEAASQYVDKTPRNWATLTTASHWTLSRRLSCVLARLLTSVCVTVKEQESVKSIHSE